VKYQSTKPSPITGRIGLSTFNTSAEFKDVRVESDGKTLYQSDFSTAAEGWEPQRGRGSAGTWAVQEGAYRQKDSAVAWSYFGSANWKDITLSVKARKLAGTEGFIISVGNADGRRIQWNVGGWGNRQHAIQAADGIVGPIARGTVESNRWYDLKVEVRDRSLRCYLDGVLTNELTLPRIDTVLAISGRDEKTGDIIVKVVNTAPEAATMQLRGAGDLVAGETITTLTSSNPTDENSFEEPNKIVPVVKPLTTMTPTLPAYSLSILRLKTR
jgi:alpha-L-arabinofuranosidase